MTETENEPTGQPKPAMSANRALALKGGDIGDEATRLSPNGLAEAHSPFLHKGASVPAWKASGNGETGRIYGALDLGTNNCRLIIVRATQRGFTIVDSFSRIIRLGEGLDRTGMLSEAAMERALKALKICAEKLNRAGVARARLIATEACRAALNGAEFIARIERETGLRLDIISREMEARLAVAGCASLLDRRSDWALVFDIGGGSSELIWLDLRRFRSNAMHHPAERLRLLDHIVEWTSIPIGVVTLAERHGGRNVDMALFNVMVAELEEHLRAFERRTRMASLVNGHSVHMLGTSGTVTTLAGVHLGLPYYDRSKVDGCWLSVEEVRSISARLVGMSYEQRMAEPCIGAERADLVLGGCAILEAVLRAWPCQRLRVADRGLREGILTSLMAEDSPALRRRRGYRYRKRGSG